jgi:hypothetical protein
MYVPTEPASNEVVTHLPLYLILKISVVLPSFTTINTFFPLGVLKATLFRFPIVLLAILVAAVGTNFEA